MGQSSHSTPRKQIPFCKEETTILSKIYANLLVRSTDTKALDYSSFSDFINFPQLWRERTCIICDEERDGLISFTNFAHFAYAASFIEEKSTFEFFFKLCDMDGDGKIDSDDLSLFLANLPDKLILAATTRTKGYPNRLHIQWKKNVDETMRVINVRGSNYETVTHQLPNVADSILATCLPISSPSGEPFWDLPNFVVWIKDNVPLLEYFYEQICPLQWLSIQTLSPLFKQILHSTTHFSASFRLLPSDAASSAARGSFWARCFTCKGAKNRKYFFEKKCKKKGIIRVQCGNNKVSTYTLLCFHHCLYLLSSRAIVDILFLRGAYVKLLHYEKLPPDLHAFQVSIGEPLQKYHKKYTFYAATKLDCDDWVNTIQNAIGTRSTLGSLMQIHDQIGTGKFSKVYSATTSGEPCAVKVVDKTMLNEIEAEMLRHELAIVRNLDHPNIAKFWETTQSGSTACFISELVTGGELYSYIIRKQVLSEEEAALVVYYLLEAVRYLHRCGIVHRDLKPENVLLEIEGNCIQNVKIIDFGLSRATLPHQLLLEQCGTLSYVAPEVLLKYGYGNQVDLWSIGIIMHLMLRGTLPFDSRERYRIVEKTISRELDFSHPTWNRISTSGKDLLGRLLDKNPHHRIKVEEALMHPWIIEKVKLKAMKEKWVLYPEITLEQKQRFEETLSMVTVEETTQPQRK